MSDAIEALYKEVVLDHYRNPRNRQALDEPDGSALVVNPVCGDQVRVDVTVDNGCIGRVSARTRGCSIAVAAGSVMSELVAGCSAREIESLYRALERLVGGEAATPDMDRPIRHC